ncbi:MAG: 3-oxoacyl-[acyl-carrier-protein] reductase [Chloroflexi bacterium]|nr:3-oxoacyl-[acyl-carrier-protein] reductase [Chloroflexota bacterium]
MDLSGKVALVTGSGRGIGRAIAVRLAAAGATVALNAISSTDATEKVITSTGGSCSAHLGDVRDAQAVDGLVNDVVSRHGSLDILVNNAGVTRDGLLMRMSESDWQDVLDTNLTGAFHCTRAVLRRMVRKRWGRIVNIGSVVGLRGNAGQANYTATKAGLVGLTRTTAREVVSRGITANVIAPGFIETELTDKLGESIQDQIRSHIPLGRFGSPEDVAEAVTFLATDEAGYITGQVLLVDGGLALA